jgi:hypothetical protein
LTEHFKKFSPAKTPSSQRKIFMLVSPNLGVLCAPSALLRARFAGDMVFPSFSGFRIQILLARFSVVRGVLLVPMVESGIPGTIETSETIGAGLWFSQVGAVSSAS